MKAVAPALAKKLSAALDSILNKGGEDRRLLAKTLGVQYRTLAYWLSADRHIPAYILPQLCKQLDDYEPLNILEAEAGRMAFLLPPTAEGLESADVRAIQRLVQEVGEALEALADTLADGKVEEHELPTTISKLEDVIHECGRLKHWLRKRCDVDKQRTSNVSP